MKYIDKACLVALKLLPEACIGDMGHYRRSAYRIYGDKDYSENIYKMRYNTCKRYIMIICLSVVMVSACVVKFLVFSEPQIYVDERGRQYVLRPDLDEGDRNYILQVQGEGDKSYSKEIQMKISPYMDEHYEEDSTEKDKQEVKEEVESKDIFDIKINNLIGQLEESTSKDRVFLPKELEDVGTLQWSEPKDISLGLCVLLAIGLFSAVYLDRYSEIKRLSEKCAESIEAELPEFLNKLVLLMNAGLVLTVAFERIVEEYEGVERDCYFYNQLKEIKIKMEEMNSPMIHEIKAFAERSCNREFMRVANIMNENINKGTKLVETLEAESNFLWYQRKKKAEEKGRLAETKLTFPLAMQLMALIIITLMPAMLEM